MKSISVIDLSLGSWGAAASLVNGLVMLIWLRICLIFSVISSLESKLLARLFKMAAGSSFFCGSAASGDSIGLLKRVGLLTVTGGDSGVSCVIVSLAGRFNKLLGLSDLGGEAGANML